MALYKRLVQIAVVKASIMTRCHEELDKGVLETPPWNQGSDRIGGSNGQQDVQSRHETIGEKQCHVGLHAASEHKTRRLPKLNLGPTSEEPPNPGLARLLSTESLCLLSYSPLVEGGPYLRERQSSQ